MNMLVTGGTGYVGSLIVEELIKEGHSVVILDNLQQGHEGAVAPGADFVLADIHDSEALARTFERFRVEAVMHMAAETLVEYSITDPKRFFQNNIVGGINVLNAMLENGLDRFVFSSTAAVYGEPQSIPIQETYPKSPVNAYGESKLVFERILDWYGKAYGLKHISLRYFNAAGASEQFGEDHRPETHLIPNVLKAALDESNPVAIFGTDYPTNDGSCIRDYVHVVDIAKAHILAMDKIEGLRGKAYNLGNGEGYSVLEVIEVSKEVTGVIIPTTVCPRRSGDPAVLVASSDQAKAELGWTPEYPSLESIIESAWRWTKQHPNGYGG